ncbi:hypothetical protein NDU88_008778 [Pleurodeles waltl]|uniref:Uncharacterized protein n=1 Tax=Pleurodeles waltl TaxID=8319 RepID=A0AAV7PQT0_PLEWA|nr:hypothetical protein NDU88_008778 [Pleurodeles waltl]
MPDQKEGQIPSGERGNPDPGQSRNAAAAAVLATAEIADLHCQPAAKSHESFRSSVRALHFPSSEHTTDGLRTWGDSTSSKGNFGIVNQEELTFSGGEHVYIIICSS